MSNDKTDAFLRGFSDAITARASSADEALGYAIEEPLPGMPEPPPGNKYEPLPRAAHAWSAPEVESYADAVELLEAILAEMRPFPEKVIIATPELVRARTVTWETDHPLTYYERAKASRIATCVRDRLGLLSVMHRMPELALVIGDRAAIMIWGSSSSVVQLTEASDDS